MLVLPATLQNIDQKIYFLHDDLSIKLFTGRFPPGDLRVEGRVITSTLFFLESGQILHPGVGSRCNAAAGRNVQIGSAGRAQSLAVFCAQGLFLQHQQRALPDLLPHVDGLILPVVPFGILEVFYFPGKDELELLVQGGKKFLEAPAALVGDLSFEEAGDKELLLQFIDGEFDDERRLKMLLPGLQSESVRRGFEVEFQPGFPDLVDFHPYVCHVGIEIPESLLPEALECES